MFLNRKNRLWMVTLLLASSCNRPNAPATQSHPGAVPFSTAATAPRSDTQQLSTAVAQILTEAHRSGSVVYRVACGPERSLMEEGVTSASLATEPMGKALDQLTRSYPGLKWEDSATGVRVLDPAVTGGLLRVRVPEFTIVEDRDADTALAALWRTPEVIRYMAAHDLRFARSDSTRTMRRAHGVVVVHMKNATVADIVQRIAASYPNKSTRFWSYRECERGSETLVEIKIL